MTFDQSTSGLAAWTEAQMTEPSLPLDASELRAQILNRLEHDQGKDLRHATLYDIRMALTLAVRDRVIGPWFAATRATYAAQAKRVYYLSMEFLLGRLLEDALLNLGLKEAAAEALASLGYDWRVVVDDEPDAALGNGGLGRLAACFLDSLSTLGVPAYGYGIRYEHGLFRQCFLDGRQVEEPEDWLRQRHGWEFDRPEASFRIGFGGHVVQHGESAVWTPDDAVIARAYDTPIVGWQGRWANTLRLWAAEPVRALDLAAFNRGDYQGASAQETLARSISRVLYPDDTTEKGKELRLRQEYFFTAASLRDILRRFCSEYTDLRSLPARVAIQLNDTHPAIAGPELVRLLHDERGMPFAEAVEVARRCLNYTNHTLMPEALERWPEPLFRRILPRHLQIIERIDAMHARLCPQRTSAIYAHGEVHMGPLAFFMASRVNGVSALHTELMKKTVFADLHACFRERIVNETNGVTPRRWLKGANPALSKLITEAIGPGWEVEAERLEALKPLAADAGFCEQIAAIKAENKRAFARFLAHTLGFAADPGALFDAQIKRIHEYKRQHLNILETIALWQALRHEPGFDAPPRLKIFAGKAAPGYVMAKEIIFLINSVAQVINADPRTRDRLRVVFLPNYNVSLAEKIIPASDLSEQISTAGKEASGTGNMKFAMNGALTIGTFDGANIEIRQRVGPENFFLFGMTADEVVERRKNPRHAAEAIAASPRLARALEEIERGTFSGGNGSVFAAITRNLREHDWFCVCADFDAYWAAQRAVDAAWANQARWAEMAALNIAGSGWFSSDRTIRGYMREIWNAQSLLLTAQ